MLSPTEILLVNHAFTLALCPEPAPEDYKTPCRYHHSFLRTLFTMSQCPFYEDSKEKFLSGLRARKNCAPSKQQVSFLVAGTEQHVFTNAVLSCLLINWRVGHVAHLKQTWAPAFMAGTLSLAHVSSLGSLLPLIPHYTFNFTSMYLNIWRLL